MSIKRYEVNGSSSVFEDDSGSLVDYQDYATLEAKCAALAAEVEAVKSAHQDAVNTIMYTANRTGVLYTEKTIQMSCKTPATDAFLAEVRASAVDEVCLKISNAIVNCYQDEQVGLDAAAAICGDFAAQLRQDANTAELVAAGIITKVGE